jgi:hypothetical protein
MEDVARSPNATSEVDDGKRYPRSKFLLGILEEEILDPSFVSPGAVSGSVGQ